MEALPVASYKKKPKNLVPIWFSSMKAAFCSFPTYAELGHQKERHLCTTTLISAVKFPPSVRFLFLPSESIWPSTCNSMTLLLDSGVLADQQLNERTQQRFAAFADIVHKLEETQVEREFLLGNAPMRAKPTPK